MKQRRARVGVITDGVAEVHLPDTTGNYATLCGLDGDDPELEQRDKQVSAKARIDCSRCIEIWRLCQGYRSTDFAAPHVPTGEPT